MQFPKLPAALSLVLLGTVLGVGMERFLLAERQPAEQMPVGESAIEHALKHRDPDYVCPMHPEIVAAEPGSCPICGMDLVQTGTSIRGCLRRRPDCPRSLVTPEFIHNFGVRTATVTRGPVSRRIMALGRVSRMPQPRVTEVTAGPGGETVGGQRQDDRRCRRQG